ncbi:MAG: hypothetical protein Q8L48_06860 [Archangium sp.]|nr:hypothetical protein [Archangium sp.]
MPRLVRLIAVLSIVGVSAPAFACRTGGGVGIQLGSVFFGFSRHRHNCPPVVVQAVPVPLPPVAYYTQQPQVVYAPPPVVYSPPPMVYAAPPPPVVYANAPLVAAPVVQAKVARPQRERPGLLAVKYMPGVSTNPSMPDGSLEFDGTGFAHSPGIEVRLTRWFALRSDLEFRQGGRTWDMLGVKLSLFPNSPVKPYGSVSFSGNENYQNPGKYSFGFAAAGGLDVFIGKHFFLEAEVRYRMTPGACCSDVPALTGLVGGGVAFF